MKTRATKGYFVVVGVVVIVAVVFIGRLWPLRG